MIDVGDHLLWVAHSHVCLLSNILLIASFLEILTLGPPLPAWAVLFLRYLYYLT